MARHDAFISYSRHDRTFAESLEQRLEKYKPPKELELPQRYLDIFRDEKDFTGPEYNASLSKHLTASASMIVLCSPDSRASEYVDQEIRKFAQTNGTDRIVPVLVAGIPNNEVTPGREDEMAFPRALCELFEMPLAVNYLGFRPGRDRVDKGAYFDAWFTLLANIFGVSRSEIEQRERKRRARRLQVAFSATSAVIALLVVALIMTLISRSEAVEQAIAARHETATRLSIQALEKIDGAPETALRLAIRAVETYHQHGDPPVSRALEALQKAGLSFGGGRPAIEWRDDQASVVLSPDLRWVATSGTDGSIRFAATGSGPAAVLQPPVGALTPGDRWADEPESKLLFTAKRLIAARMILSGEDRWPKKAAIWSWSRDDAGIAAEPELIATLGDASWRDVKLVPSGDGRWLSWGDGKEFVYLNAIGSSRTPLSFESDDSLQLLRVFSDDSREFVVATNQGLQKVVLNRPPDPPASTPGLTSPDGVRDRVTTVGAPTRELAERVDQFVAVPEELLTSSEQLRRAVAISTTTRRGRRLADGTWPQGISRVAVMFRDGNVEWWDLDAQSTDSVQLGSLFSAYEKEMKVVGLERSDIRVKFEFGPAGQGLLAAVAHESGEFGVVSRIDLADGQGWIPLPMEQLQRQLSASVSRTQGSTHGATSGYRLFDQKLLGAADAWWFSDEGAVTLGLDGTLLFRDFESGRSSLIATEVSTALVPVIGEWLLVGRQNGKLRLVDIDDGEDYVEINGHDLPLRALMQDRDQSRVVSIDEAGVARAWWLKNPILNPGDFDLGSRDWRYGKMGHGSDPSIWDLRSPDPFSQSVVANLPPNLDRVSSDENGDWTATLEPDNDDRSRITVKLWAIHDGQLAETPEVTREFSFPGLPEHWRWDSRGKLSVAGGKATFLVIGQQFGGQGVWLVDLRNADSSPHPIVGPDEKLAVRSVSRNSSRMLLGRDDRSSRENREVQVWDLDESSSEPLLTIAGTAHGDLSADGRWLTVHDRLFDLAGDLDRPRLEVENWDDWPSEFLFAPGRPPLFIDRKGSLWGLDHVVGSQLAPQLLVADMALSEVTWDDSSLRLALGDAEGRVWVLAPEPDAEIATLAEELMAVTTENPLPAPWDVAARDEIRRIELLHDEGWVLASTDNDYHMIWRGRTGEGWAEPLVFDDRALFEGYSAFQCREDGQQCLVGGQFMTFDEHQLLSISKALLSGWQPQSTRDR